MIVEIVDFETDRVLKVYRNVQDVTEGILDHILIKTESVNHLVKPNRNNVIKITKDKD